MDKRTRLLLIAVLVVVVGFLLDKFLLGPFTDRWGRLSDDIRKSEADLVKAQAIVSRETDVRKDWGKIRTLLEQPRSPDIQTHFLTHVNEIGERVGVSPDIQADPRAVQQGDFKEYVYEVKIRLPWEKLIAFLVEINNSKEFMKVQRLGVTSRYEQEDLLDVNVKLSTIGGRQ